jgi:hypothetical protein
LLDGAGHVDAHEALARDVVGCHFLVEGECGAVPFAQCGDDEGDEGRVLIFDGDFVLSLLIFRAYVELFNRFWRFLPLYLLCIWRLEDK